MDMPIVEPNISKPDDPETFKTVCDTWRGASAIAKRQADLGDTVAISISFDPTSYVGFSVEYQREPLKSDHFHKHSSWADAVIAIMHEMEWDTQNLAVLRRVGEHYEVL